MDNGYLHVGTGYIGNNSSSNTFYYYDPNSNSWIYHSTMNAEARYGATGFSINNNLYVYGGLTSSGYTLGDMLEYTTTNGQGIFVLPEGYRPTSGTISFIVSNNNSAGKVEILWDGAVFVQNCAAGSISLDGISFRAD